jgi:hypothetical protein
MRNGHATTGRRIISVMAVGVGLTITGVLVVLISTSAGWWFVGVGVAVIVVAPSAIAYRASWPPRKPQPPIRGAAPDNLSGAHQGPSFLGFTLRAMDRYPPRPKGRREDDDRTRPGAADDGDP